MSQDPTSSETPGETPGQISGQTSGQAASGDQTPASAPPPDPRIAELTQDRDRYKQSHDDKAAEIKRLRREVEEFNVTLKDSLAVVRPVARPVRARKRHYGLVAGFIGVVVLPVGLAAGYLYTLAADQYASTMAFTVRSEDVSSSAADLLGGIGAGLAGGVGGSTGTDADILYEFIHSPDMVRRIVDQVDLPQIYSRHGATDPVFAFDPDGTIEDLTSYWTRMVTISYDSTSRLMEVTTRAFTPEDARTIAETIFAESSRMINELSDIARIDGTRYAQEDLDTAVARLKSAREALTQFRLENEIVDVDADIQSQMGLLAGLQTQQTEALIELDLLTDSARPDDPRLDQAQRRLAVIETRINEERRKFGAGGAGPSGESYANTVAQFESLSVDREFAELAYASALSAYDTAKAEANRQSRYLAAYITPTLAQQAEYPRRLMLTGTVALFALLTWIIGSLVYYALRERR